MLAGTKRASTAFAAADAIPTFAASACWRSENAFNGTFANTNWSLAFRIRAVSAVSAQTGSIKVRLWRSANADGTGATQLTAAVQTGTTTAVLSTTVSASSTVTWAPGGTIVLNGEYLWVQCEWNIVATSGSNSCDAVFYVESAGVITTPDFTLGAVDGDLALTELGDTLSGAGGPIVDGDLALTELGDTLSGAGGSIVDGDLTRTEAGDTISATADVAFTGVSGDFSLLENADVLIGPGTVTGTFLDSSRKSSRITLSGGNLTATRAS